MQDKTIIETVGLVKKFGNKVVLNGINSTIKEGEKIAVIGPSGSGKSTYLRCLNMLETPTGGKVSFNGDILFESYLDKELCLLTNLKLERKNLKKGFYNDNVKGVLDEINFVKSEKIQLKEKHKVDKYENKIALRKAVRSANFEKKSQIQQQ
ncbi:MAG: ATP-binding cassette domain-containing protein, partial [Clostridia bacterium]|nr:ATP-binding cassette domain-containing protein [Clostridia bacterium]